MKVEMNLTESKNGKTMVDIFNLDEWHVSLQNDPKDNDILIVQIRHRQPGKVEALIMKMAVIDTRGRYIYDGSINL